MRSEIPFISFALFSSFGICVRNPTVAWTHLSKNQKFTLEQVPVERKTPWTRDLKRTYLKYGRRPPAYIEEALKSYEAMESNRTTVNAKPFYSDMEYLVDVKVGNLNLSLDLDTGSADLYVPCNPLKFHCRI
jgi:hypothetical protein